MAKPPSRNQSPGQIAKPRRLHDAAIKSVADSDQKAEPVNRAGSIIAAERYEGPLPHPRHLAEYEKIHPGSADRILAMAEKALERNETREDNLIAREYDDRARGMYLGFGALFLLVASGTIVSVFGNIWIGGALLTASVLGAVISPFVNGRLSLSRQGDALSQKKTSKD